jgi:hypothetical protein
MIALVRMSAMSCERLLMKGPALREERIEDPDERLDCNPTYMDWRASHLISQFQK